MPLPTQSAEVPPIYNNLMIISGLMATLRWGDEHCHERSSLFIERYHRIHPSVVTLVAGDAHGAEDAPEAIGADLIHQAGVDAVQVLVDIGGTEHLWHFALTRYAVVTKEELLYRLVTTEAAVALLDVAHLVGSEPVSLAMGKQVHALGIELWVVTLRLSSLMYAIIVFSLVVGFTCRFYNCR